MRRRCQTIAHASANCNQCALIEQSALGGVNRIPLCDTCQERIDSFVAGTASSTASTRANWALSAHPLSQASSTTWRITWRRIHQVHYGFCSFLTRGSLLKWSIKHYHNNILISSAICAAKNKIFTIFTYFIYIVLIYKIFFYI